MSKNVIVQKPLPARGERVSGCGRPLPCRIPGHKEVLRGDASARITTQRYCYVVTFVNRVNGIKSLFLSLMSEDIRKEPWMLVFPALTTLLYEDWLPTG